MWKVLAGFVLVTSAMLLGACSLAGDVTPPPGLENAPVEPVATVAPLTAPRQAPDLQAGEILFAERCAPCHGDGGLGDGPQASALPNPPAALANPSVARAAVPDDWYSIVTLGRLDRFMPGFTSLNDAQRWSVVGYALSLGLASADLSEGERVFADNCESCHGPDGPGAEAGPDLTNLDFQASQSEQAMFDVVTEGRPPDMPSFADSLTDDERWAVVDLLRQVGLHAGAEPAAPSATPTAEATAEGSPAAETPAATAGGTPEAETPVATGTTPTLEPTVVSGGSIIGTIVNGTGGDAAPSQLDVTLHGFDGDTEVLTDSRPAKPDGTFTFEVAELTPGRLYVATVDYQGSQYASDIVHLSSDAPSATLPITVYETTTDTSTVLVDRLHILVTAPGEGVLEIVELWILSNSGDRTVIPSESRLGLEGTLPEGASNVSFDETTPGERFQVSGGAFVDKRPLPPGSGTGEWVFSYSLPYGRRLDLRRTAAYPIGSVVILAPEGLKVAADGLSDTGSRDVQGQTLHTYSLGPISPGTEMALRMSGNPASAAAATPAAPWILGVAALGVAMIGAGLLWFRPRRRPVEAEDEEPEGEIDEDNVDELVAALARLDQDFESGGVPEDEYRVRRETLKRRALEAMRRA
ncbi:MAG TPA: c-type cytochrome [Anaerolineales bacterium]|nr:c-type cytochrome [Anaerolineales bacterium]